MSRRFYRGSSRNRRDERLRAPCRDAIATTCHMMLALSGRELGKDCCQIGSVPELHFILQAP
jgi:hypothetical protein